MSGFSLWWIDWRRFPDALIREAAGRFCLFLMLGGFFAALLLSGGVNRYLSERWAVSAVLRPSVTSEEGEGIARKVAGLPEVRAAAYRDPETSWNEFIEAYPGLEGLRAAGGNPLPGYIEVRLRPGRFTESGIRSVEAALKPLPEVEKILSGGEVLPRLLRIGRWMNVLFWAAFCLLCVVSFAVFFLQEKARASYLSDDFGFLAERGIPSRSISMSRAAGTALVGGVLSLAAMAASAFMIFVLSGRLPLFSRAIGPADEILTLSFLVPGAIFPAASAMLSGGASLLGWRAAQSGKR